MSPLITIILTFLAALIFGLLLFIIPIIAYYWGPNGKPPTTPEERRKLREEELQMRAKQIEHSKNNPIVTRKPSFWDNRKVYKK